MPPRKSDQHRKSDVSTARFEVMEEGAPAPAASVPPPGPESVIAVADTEASPTVLPRIGHEEKKDKEKEKEKDKDKGDKGDKDAVTIEDLSLPKSIITRLAKGVLPPNTQIQSNAIMALSKSATVFISYLASHANENATDRNKVTIMPEDVFKALDDTEFSFLVEPLKAEYEKFASDKSNKRKSYRASKKSGVDGDSQMADVSGGPGGPDDTMMTTASDATAAAAGSSADASADQPRAKKAKLGAATGVATIAGGAAAAAAVAGGEEDVDDDETEPEDQGGDQDEDDEDEAAEEEEEEEEDDEEEGSDGDETQDALEDRPRKGEEDEALDGDESD